MENTATPWHGLTPEEALSKTGSSTSGLTATEAGERLVKYGANELRGKKKPSLIKVFLRQFLSPLIYVLLAAGIISLVSQFITGEEHFIEVFVDTPIEVCEDRDIKGLYARARRGQITGFTGVDDPYEAPVNPEITLDTVNSDALNNARKIVSILEERGFVINSDGKAASEIDMSDGQIQKDHMVPEASVKN